MSAESAAPEPATSAQTTPAPGAAVQPRARVTAVTSGKGGVGKTFLTANLAAALAQRGERVLVLDADLGLANLDVALNLVSKITLHDVFTGKADLDAAILSAPGGFSVLLAGSGLVEYSRLAPEVREHLLKVIETLAPRFDRILLDTGAGISDLVLYTVSLAGEVLIVATPEPTSLTDAYATIKVLATQQQRRVIRLVVNQVHRQGDGRAICSRLQRVVDRFVTPFVTDGTDPIKLDFLGDIPMDSVVREAVQRRQLLFDALPRCTVSVAVSEIAQRLAL